MTPPEETNVIDYVAKGAYLQEKFQEAINHNPPLTFLQWEELFDFLENKRLVIYRKIKNVKFIQNEYTKQFGYLVSFLFVSFNNVYGNIEIFSSKEDFESSKWHSLVILEKGIVEEYNMAQYREPTVEENIERITKYLQDFKG